jgi:hypothetical protein
VTPEERARAVQAAALADFQAGKIANEFYAKEAERPFTDADVERVLKSRSSGVWRYVYDDEPRYGFWHPDTTWFVAWRPNEEGYESELKTCFDVLDGARYVQNRSDVKCLREPKG